MASYKSMATKLTEAKARDLFGDLEERARELEAFSRGARTFAVHQARLEADHEGRWIAIHEDDTEAARVVVGEGIEQLRTALEDSGVREGECFVRFVSRPRGKLIV